MAKRNTINFLDKAWTTRVPADVQLFGVYDPPRERPAVSLDPLTEDEWIAVVTNLSRQEVTFVAIDNGVLAQGDLAGEPRCDCMILTRRHLYFIELKDRNNAADANSKGKKQLASTIALFRLLHPQDFLSRHIRRAYVCNRKALIPQRIYHAEKEHFKRLGVRLFLQRDVSLA